jgi:hypothetical protein
MVGLVIITGCGKPPDSAPQHSAPQRPSPPGPIAAVDPAKDKKAEPKAPPRPDKAEFKFSSVDFGKEFIADAKTAKAKYKDKWIELSGPVTGVGHRSGDRPFVDLKGPFDPKRGDDFKSISCFIAEKEPWKKYSPQQPVKIFGKFNDFGTNDMYLVEGVVVEAGADPSLVLSAEQLAKECTADFDGTVAKYKDKYIILSGEIIGKESNDAGAPTLQLKADGKTKVFASLTAFDKELVADWKAGQKVSVVGQFILNLKAGEVYLYHCMPREGPK